MVGQYGEDVVNDNGQQLIAVCEQNELRIMNGFHQHRWIHKHTWTHITRNLSSIIDYTIVRQKTYTTLKIHDVRV